jgi:hypothetical protein
MKINSSSSKKRPGMKFVYIRELEEIQMTSVMFR